jgi:hypothetical protein
MLVIVGGEHMLKELFRNSLILSGTLRPEYPQSLGNRTEGWQAIIKETVSDIPDIYIAIYNNVSGTKRNIQCQEFMDYIPGYRLIHITEIAEEQEKINCMLGDAYDFNSVQVMPLLADYASDFICYCRFPSGEESICLLMNGDGSLVPMCKMPEDFLKTICEFYKQKVYFLDKDGYLDYDMEKEQSVGSRLNPEVDYWLED